MITVWLLWTLVGGQPHDVDAFLFESDCKAARDVATHMLEQAQAQRPELKDITFSACKSVSLPEPK